MLKTLIKKQMLELFQTYFINNKTGKARTKAGTMLFFGLFILLFGGLGIAFYAMAAGLGNVILGSDINWIYFALMSLLSIALGVFGSVFNTYDEYCFSGITAVCHCFVYIGSYMYPGLDCSINFSKGEGKEFSNPVSKSGSFLRLLFCVF